MIDIKQVPFTVKDIKELYGGKGFYLLWLANKISKLDTQYPVAVPPFRIIPIHECEKYLIKKELHRESIESYLNTLPRRKYSVRSGAAKSLPGLMDTILFVKRNNVHSEVKKVFESFLGVPEDVRKDLKGTAAIIQCMATVLPKNDVAVGVVFPKIKNNRVELTFRYKKRVGDDIVSGKSEEDGVMIIIDLMESIVHKDSAFYQVPIVKIFQEYLSTFHHPPEFEIIIDFTKKSLFFLQARDYKLTPAEAKFWLELLKDMKLTPSTNIMELASKNKTIIVDKQPILEAEGEGVCYGKITKSDYKKKKYIKYIESGVSLEWINAVKRDNCVGIAFSTGSLHCHGVVLAKGYGKAYIKIPKKDIAKILNKEITLIDGKIYKGKLDIEEESIDTNTTKSTEITPKLVRDKISALYVYSSTDALTELTKYKLAILNRIPQNELENVLNEAITRFVVWGVLACIGEVRHWSLAAEGHALEIKRKEMFGFLKHLKTTSNPYINIMYDGVTNKTGNKQQNIYDPLIEILHSGVRKKVLYDTMDTIEFIFKQPSKAIIKILGTAKLSDNYEKYYFAKDTPFEKVLKQNLACFSPGYGGKAWGRIAEATKNLIKVLGVPTDINTILALLNTIEALHHNNAVFFNKFIPIGKVLKMYNEFNKGETIFLEYIKEEVPGVAYYIGENLNTLINIDPDKLPISSVF